MSDGGQIGGDRGSRLGLGFAHGHRIVSIEAIIAGSQPVTGAALRRVQAVLRSPSKHLRQVADTLVTLDIENPAATEIVAHAIGGVVEVGAATVNVAALPGWP